MRALVIALVLVASSLAHAEPDKKSPGIAVVLSTAVTLAGFAVTADSIEWGETKQTLVGATIMFLGPSTGRWYADNHGLPTLGLRAVGGALFMYGLSRGALSVCDEPSTPCDRPAIGPAATLAGAGLWIGTTIADVVFAHRDAREYNARHVSITPTIQTPSGGATGLALTGTF